jgi:hypothetical protein
VRKVLKKLFNFVLLPIVLLGRVLRWPFRRRSVSEAEPKPEPNIIEQIAEELIEGIPYKPEPKLRGGPYSLNYSGLDYNEYKHANKKSISVRDWSFAPKRYGNPNYTRKVMNDWKWRMVLGICLKY